VDYDGVGTMSKSKKNGVDPQKLIEAYGADTARLFMMFAAPPEASLEWSDTAVEGAYRFLKRLWSSAHQHRQTIQFALDEQRAGGADRLDWSKAPPKQKAIRREIHLNLRQANNDFSRFQFNTVVSACMKILNLLAEMPGAVPGEQGHEASGTIREQVICEGMSVLLRLLSPITPHICHALWRELGYGEDILLARWPEPDESALIQDEIELVLQVNGKLRGNIRVPAGADRTAVEQAALASEAAQKFMAGQPARKVVVVPGRLVNIVV
jgi:leucyl-tRNA synthetase